MTTKTTRLPFYKRLSFEETFWGWLLTLPAILGLLLFRLGRWSPVSISALPNTTFSPHPQMDRPGQLSGVADRYLLAKVIQVTLHYSVLFIPLSLIVAYTIGLLMSQDLKGIAVYRTMWYLPSLVPTVASAVVWRWALNPEFGPVNFPSALLGLTHQFVTDPDSIIPSVVLIQLWGLGNAALIFLAAIKGVPGTYYEAAEVDGANAWMKFWKITLPMTSSVIFFRPLWQSSASFQSLALPAISSLAALAQVGGWPWQCGPFLCAIHLSQRLWLL